MEILQQLAFDALEESGYSQLVESTDEDVVANENKNQTPEELTEGVKESENEDGSVTYTVSFSIDPTVQKEMASAIKKGTKREDQADVQLDEAGREQVSPNEKTEDVLPCCAQDETPFSDVLDAITEVSTEDSVRNYNSPLNKCLAKNPMYCRYHGVPATKKFLEDEIKKFGGQPPMSIDVVKDDNDYHVSITVPSGANGQPYLKALTELMSKRGVMANGGINSEVAPNNTDDVHIAAFSDDKDDGNTDYVMDEWISNLMEDFADDPASPLDPNDVAGIFADYGEYKALPGDRTKTWGKNATPTPQDMAKAQAYDALEGKYHQLRAQVEKANVKTPADAQKDRTDIGNIRAKAGDWWNMVSEASEIWAAAGVKPRSKLAQYPKQAQAIREKFHNKYNRLYNRVCRPYEQADKQLAAALQAGDMKTAREALHTLNDFAEIYADVFPSFKKVATSYIDAAKTYAQQQGVAIPQHQQKPWTP